MVIEHNIPGLNANRNRTKNSSKLAKSLERLSTGYAINRAADNAAGLAVSEKMRSQIGGMKQAIKNCRDGISLIQTFEGALDETVAIIKRAKTLADQAANGTYDDSIDRSAIEIEYLHLCDEIDHIAGTDFNGIVMLSGQPDSAARAEARINSALNDMPDIHTQQADTAVMSLPEVSHTGAPKKAMAVFSKAAVFAAPKAAGTVCGDFTVYGDPVDFSFDTGTGVLTILGGDVTVEGTGAATTNTIVVAKDKSANVTLKDVNIDVSGTFAKCAFLIEDDSKGNVTVTLEGDNTLKSGAYYAGLQKNGGLNSGTLTINGNGSLNAYGSHIISGYGGGAGIGGGTGIQGGTQHANCANITIISGNVVANGSRGAAGIGGGRLGSGINIQINGGNVTARGGDGGAGIGSGQYSSDVSDITINGGKVNTIGGNSAAGIGDGHSCRGTNITINDGEVVAFGGFNGAGIGEGSTANGSGVITINNGKIISEGFGAAAGIGGGTFNQDIFVCVNGGVVNASGFQGGAGIGGGVQGGAFDIKIRGGNVTATGSDVYSGVIADILGGAGIGGGYGSSGNITIENKATIVIAKGGKKAQDIGNGSLCGNISKVNINSILIKEPYTGNGITDGTIVHYTGTNPDPPDPDKPDPPTPDKPTPSDPVIPDDPDNPDTPEKLTVSISDPYQNAAANLTYTNSLILQAGARTKDSVKFTFAYTAHGIGDLTADLDCTAKGLGMDTLTFSAQESANLAIDRLDHALCKVSMIRSTFGAAQNRLEHKIDNLCNTAENLTAAESRIRDTDMAREMTEFTKNQIITQSSQAMLAQANMLPQQAMSLINS